MNLDGEMVIVPEQAETVRKIFDLYLQGLTFGQIKSYFPSSFDVLPNNFMESFFEVYKLDKVYSVSPQLKSQIITRNGKITIIN